MFFFKKKIPLTCNCYNMIAYFISKVFICPSFPGVPMIYGSCIDATACWVVLWTAAFPYQRRESLPLITAGRPGDMHSRYICSGDGVQSYLITSVPFNSVDILPQSAALINRRDEKYSIFRLVARITCLGILEQATEVSCVVYFLFELPAYE